MPHPLADKQVIIPSSSSLTLNIMFLCSATCPMCRQRLDEEEEEEEEEEGQEEEEEGQEEEE